MEQYKLVSFVVILLAVSCCATDCSSGFVISETPLVVSCNFGALGNWSNNTDGTLFDMRTGIQITNKMYFSKVEMTATATVLNNHSVSCQEHDNCLTCTQSTVFIATQASYSGNYETKVFISDQACLLSNTSVCSTNPVVCIQGQIAHPDLCDLKQCNYCPQWRTWGACHANKFGFWKTILSLLAVVVILFMIPWFLPALSLCFRGCKKAVVGLSCLFLCCIKSGRDVSQKAELVIMSNDEDEEDGLSGEDHPTAEQEEAAGTYSYLLPGNSLRDQDHKHCTKLVRRNNKGGLRIEYFTIFMMIAMLGCVSAQCSGIITSQNLQSVCFAIDSTKQNCSASVSANFALLGIGTTACSNLVSDFQIVGNITSKLESVTLSTSLVNQYYTSSYAVGYTSVRRCRGAGGANCNRYTNPKGCANCQQLNPCNQLPSSFNYLYNYPGESGCMDGPTCACAAGSGNACQNYRFSFIPQGTVYQIAQPSFTTITAKMTVRVCTNTCRTISVSTVQPIMADNDGIYTLTGVNFNMLPSYDSRSVVIDTTSSTKAYLAPVAPTQLASANIIGDIQSGTKAGLTNPSSNSFIYGSNIVAKASDCDGMSWTIQQPGMNKLSSYPTFPTNWGGVSLSYANGGLTGPMPGMSSSTLNVQLKNNVTFTQILNFVKPDNFKYISGFGCFSCNLGANLTFQARSSANSGSCFFSSEVGTVQNTAVQLSTVVQSFNVTVFYLNASVTDTFTLSCVGGSSSVKFSLDLYDYNTIVPNEPATRVFSEPIGNLKLGLGLGLGIGLPLLGSGIALLIAILCCGCLGTTALARMLKLCCGCSESGYQRV